MVRQEVVARQIAPLARRGMSVLDVGCGQGTQALRLASSGCNVTAINPSAALLDMCAEAAFASRFEVELLHGRIEDLDHLVGERTFDLDCCHGVLMYLDDWAQSLKYPADRLSIGGSMSVTFRNGHALAMRPNWRSDWPAAVSAFDSNRYVNELGLFARADRIDEIEEALASAGLRLVTWHGVRVFTDAAAVDAPLPDPETLALQLDAEELAGATDPSGWVRSYM